MIRGWSTFVQRLASFLTSHAWPRFGRPVIGDYLEKHRDFDDIVDHPAGVDG